MSDAAAGVGVTLFLSALNFRPGGGAAAAQSSVLDISKISVQKLERDLQRFDFEAYIYAEIIQKLERARWGFEAGRGGPLRRNKKGVASLERQRP